LKQTWRRPEALDGVFFCAEMKLMKRYLIILALLTSGCAQAVRVRSHTQDVYPPSANVTVQTTVPTVLHDTIATLTVSRGPDAVRLLMDRAKQLGAELVVITGITGPGDDALTRTRDAVVTTGMARAGQRGRVTAVALRYPSSQ
jgi:hypothetical protein